MQMTSPIISIIIPCYNLARFLSDAISSCINQSYQRIEIIVIDDGSRDETASVAKSFGSRIHYIYQENRGLPGARNRGISEAQGEYIVLLDADDLLPENYLATCISYLQDHPEVAYAYTQMKLFGRENRLTHLGDFKLRSLLFTNFVHAAAMLRKDVFRKFSYDVSFRKGWEDWDFYLTLAENGLYGGLAQGTFLLYRKHDSSDSMIDVLAANTNLEKRLMKDIFRKHPGIYGPILRRLVFVNYFYCRPQMVRIHDLLKKALSYIWLWREEALRPSGN